MIRNSIRSTVRRYYLFCFLSSFGFFSATLIPFYTEWAHINLTQVQMLQSWFMFWIFFLEIPTGAVADYVGRKYSLALGIFVMAIAALTYGSTPHFTIFLLSEFLFAIGVSLISGADSALLYDALKEAGKEKESKAIFGRAYSIDLVAMFLGALLGSVIAARFGLNAPILFSAIPFFLAACVAWSIREPEIHGKTSESKRYLDIIKQGFSYFRHHKILRLLAFDAIVVASSAYFVIWLYQPILMSLHIPILYFGWFHALIVAVEIAISTNFVRLEKMLGGGKTYLRFTAIVVSLGFLTVAAFPSIVTVILFLVLAGGFGLTRMELMRAYLNRFIPSEKRATVLSSISMFRRFALVPLNPIIGFTADHSLRLALGIVGILPLLVFFFSPIEKEALEG